MAKAYVDWLKCRSKREATTNIIKSKMQKELLSELWERLAQQQERVFDEAIAARVLNQSTYEKRIVTKLCEVRNQKNIMAENQMIFETMTSEANETKMRMGLEREKDQASKLQKDFEIECQRMCELRQRLHEEKLRKLQERHCQFCRETVKEVINLALKIEDYRQTNDGLVPETILREWKTMFVRCQPITDDEIEVEIDVDTDTDNEEEDSLFEKISKIKQERIEVLQDGLLEDYLETNPPWDAFAPMVAEDARETFELGRVVLGYVVHRLLNYIHADINKPRPSLPNTKNAVIILGIGNPTVHESIRQLLENNDIHLVRMEDAINYCLKQYKAEMLDAESIDLNIVAATNEVVKELQRGKQRISCLRKRRASSGSKSEEAVSRRSRSSMPTTKNDSQTSKMDRLSKEAKSHTQEKQTQTPRNLPFDDLDPVLSDSAYIGKWAYEYLTLGEPITNQLTTKILIEYLKSLDGAKGWVVVEYPNTYEQMSLLEAALTGSKIPPDPELLDFEDVTIEDVQSISPRIVYEDDVDPVPMYRQSRIVPDPIKKMKDIPATTFARLFVRVEQKPKSFDHEGERYERLKKDTPSIDKFYASQNVAYLLYYTNLDLTTLKTLARLVIGKHVQGKSSEELFGDALKGHDRAKEPRSTGSKAPVVRRMLPATDLEEDKEASEEEEEEEEEEVDYARGDFLNLDMRQPRPGDANWEWIEIPLPSTLVECLASLWEVAEKMYTEGLKELLFLKSVHASGLVPYKDFIVRNAWEFIKRPCNKQDLLNEFHFAFNEIDEDARHDLDVKCELHRRVADFQAQLWDICDKRRRETEEERKRFVDNDWTVFEAMMLFNVYVGMVQVEVDLFIDTIQMVQDYYLGMLKRPLQESRFPKVVLNRMQVGEVEPVNFQEQPESPKPGERLTDRKGAKRFKGGSPKPVAASSPPPAPDYALLRKEINDYLLDRNKPFRNSEDVCVFKTILENVRFARSIVDRLSALVDEVLKRETTVISKTKDLTIHSTDSIAIKAAARGHDLALESRYAFTYEVDRIRLRLDTIVAAARSELAFLLESMQRTFHRFYDAIVDRYWHEMKSVNDMADVFCFAIEEGRYLEKEMLLEDDHFVIRSNVFVMKVPSKTLTTVKETVSDTRFRIAQLARLMEIFRRVAPFGSMSERAFVYILQDVASHGMEEGEEIALPCCWYRLRPADITTLIDRLFESPDYVDWREFVVYAMDLPIPSHRDILLARDRFRIQDQDLKEVVTVAQYLWTSLWFLECTESTVDVFKLLSDDFQRNREELYEAELYHFDRERYGMSQDRFRNNSTANLGIFDSTPEETLRMILAKDLLCRMYMVDRRTVNYTALLLALCKDENPREGFSKALALAMGSRVCTDVEEGERYVEKLYEQKRAARRSQLSREASRHEARQITEEIVRRLMDRVEETIGWSVEKQSLEKLDDTTSGLVFEEEMEHEGISIISSSIFGESEFKFRPTDQEDVIYWLPLDVCLTVLTAALPWHTLKPEIFVPCRPNLRDSLIFVYQELKDEDLNEGENVVLAHRLLNHEFMKRLLNSVGKFTARNVGKMIQEILRTKENSKSG
ncbi:sperm flagellar protein 2-like [Hylaeus volcanicus]|uniref:sperm flagellar protein 2-like n=1 Tax=Hylaeus volcanicus TaxID=313075 RepID=UPI0023B81FAE|nr:sperm flagellar protein 2-like [Hylaeus volcanicus]